VSQSVSGKVISRNKEKRHKERNEDENRGNSKENIAKGTMQWIKRQN